jgi:hypothetical protein
MSVPIACTLSAEELKLRSQANAVLFSQVTRVEELADGYAFAFPPRSELVREVLEFMLAERSCCAFFSFELRLPAPHEVVWLDIRGGSDDVKKLIEAGFRQKVDQ